MVKFLENTAEACNINVKDSVDSWVKSARKDVSVNEFDNPDLCLAGAFPHIFMFGKASHSFTCHKPACGTQGCRLARPAGMSDLTCPYQLHEHDPSRELSSEHPEVDFTYKHGREEICCYRTREVQPPADQPNRNLQHQPIPTADK